MGEIETGTIAVGADARTVAFARRPGSAPGIVFLSGYRSDMSGTKAQRLDTYGALHGHAVMRFDYSGVGASGGDFLAGTISRWLEEALAIFARTNGPQVVVGSSMGGWLALLLNRALRQQGEDRVKSLVLVAPAVDMTQDLMAATFTRREAREMASTGLVLRPSGYDEPMPITRALIEDGRRHLMFGGVIETHCPVTIIQGGKDPDVPPAHALKLAQHLLLDPLTLTMIPDGNHRLSREEDLLRLEAAVGRALEDG